MDTESPESGETTDEEDPSTAYIDLGEGDGEVDSGAEDGEAGNADPTPPEEPEKSLDKPPEAKELEELKERLKKAEKDRDRAFYNLRNAKKQPEEKTDPAFTDAQLLSLWEEHKDDPAVAIQIMKEIGKQQGKSQAIDAVKEKEISAIKNDVEKFMVDRFPDYSNEESPMRAEIDKSKKMLHIENHPLGDFFAVAGNALLKMDSMLAAAKKQAREEALREKQEEGRKKAIKENSPASSKPKAKPSADSGDGKYLATAKQMGFNKRQTERYLQMMKNAAKKNQIVIND